MTIAPELPRAIRSNETGVQSIGIMYWAIGAGSMVNSNKRRPDKSYKQSFGGSNNKVGQRVSCNPVYVPGAMPMEEGLFDVRQIMGWCLVQ